MSSLPGRLGTLVARDVMTPNVVVLKETDTLESAVRNLRTRHITGAPVVCDTGRLVGLLSLSDLVDIDLSHDDPAGEASLAHGQDRTIWDLFEKAQPLNAESQSNLVSSRMSRNVASVVEITPLVEVARAMCDGHWHRVPVVNEGGALTGIISTMDLLAAIVNAADELVDQTFA